MTLADLRARLALAISRAVVRLVDDAPGLQRLQIEGLAGEIIDGAARIQDYGFTSVPRPGATAAVVCALACRDHPLVVAVDDARYRLRQLQSGDVAVYHEGGAVVHLTADGIRIAHPTRIRIEAPRVEVSATTGLHLGCAGVGPSYYPGAVVSHTAGIPQSTAAPVPVESR